MDITMHYHTIYIGVNFKTPEKAIEWVNSIHATNPKSLIVLVDNSSSHNQELYEKIKEKAVYIDSHENLGYFNGAAYGLHEIGKKHSFDWLAVTNVDLKLCTTNVDGLLDRYANAGIVAPSIISYDTGFDKNPYRLHRQSKKSVLIKKYAFSNRLFASIYSSLSAVRNYLIRINHKEGKKCDEGTAIYLPYGAAFFFSSKYFNTGCSIDFPLFLFGEELYVAEQARRAGIDIVYVPSIIFMNYEHASTSKLSSKSICRRNYDAMKFILDEFYSKE